MKIKDLSIALVGILSFIYLLNFTFGFAELPDNLPLVGNIDEAVAAALLLNSLKYFGVDLTNLFKKKPESK